MKTDDRAGTGTTMTSRYLRSNCIFSSFDFSHCFICKRMRKMK